MPILFEKKVSPSARLAVWQIEESEDFFFEKLLLVNSEKAELEKIQGNRRLHFLASRVVLHQLLGEKKRLKISKTDGGKPFWPDRPEAHFSLSHSEKLAAAILDEKAPCGIDVQRIGPKMERVAPRVLTEKELEMAAGDLEKLHFFWGAKESMYKAYGLRELDFREHLFVDSFKKGRAEKGNVALAFDLFEQKIELEINVFELVWAVESKK